MKQHNRTLDRTTTYRALCLVTLWSTLSLTGCGGGGDGAAVQAQSQSLTISSTPTLNLNGNAQLTSSASSGLQVQYVSRTPAVCSVDNNSGVVSAITLGTCVIAIEQSGNAQYAPAQTQLVTLEVKVDPNQSISFDPLPNLALGSTATISAKATSGLPVTYSTTTPSVCTINSLSGVTTGLTIGTCTIHANQSGDSSYLPAPQASANVAISVPAGVTVPQAPLGVTVKAIQTLNEVTIQASSVNAGGMPLTSFTAVSMPGGFTATSNTLPVQVRCTPSCVGESFQLRATNALGDGEWSALTDIIDTYEVSEVFYEPDTQPRDSIFIGTFKYNASKKTVSNLQGRLSESMTGSLVAYPNDTMTWLDLTHQLKSWRDETLGGTFVATFKNANTNTFWTGTGGDGWSPGAGVDAGGVYYGFPKATNNPGNAYALIFVPDNPLTPLTPSQLARLAYADCAPGGMMGAVCMTGTSVAGYGAIGTMSGFPQSQIIKRLP